MPYSAELKRTSPSCILFLIDQSRSMAEAIGGQAGQSKADGVAEGINRLLQNLVFKCAKSDGVRDYFHVGVIGYGDKVAWSLGGKLAGQRLVPVSVLANNPLRVEERTRKVGTSTTPQKYKFPVWFETVANGKTPMCAALALATKALAEFVRRFSDTFPPIVINISDGKATDGNPEAPATQLRKLSTTDGNVLLFNAHLSSSAAKPIEFPGAEDELPDLDACTLFRMSSPLPDKFRQAAGADGFRVQPTSRGFVFNADLVSVVRFLDVGTRVAHTVR